MSTPLDEYRILADDLRHYSVLRLYRLTLLLGTIGAIVTAVASEAVRSHAPMFAAIKGGGFAVLLVFAIMDYRSGERWLALKRRSGELASSLGFAGEPPANGWNPLTTTGASRCLHLGLVATWGAVLVATWGRD